MGADAICIKDMANLLRPVETYELVSELKKKISIPIHLHTHNTTGTGAMVYFAAAMAGVDIIDGALSPFSNGTSQPATETLVAAFRGTPCDTGLDLRKLGKAASHFRAVARRMEEDGLINNKVLRVAPETLLNQIPGGMISNLLSQLNQMDAGDRIDEVMAEIPQVRKDFGYPPLVTPVSQIIGTQAVLNVLSGKYQSFTKESKALLRGEYGELPGTVNKELRKQAIGSADVVCCRPADLLEPELELIKERYKNIAKTEEDLLSCAMYPVAAAEFIKKRDNLMIYEIDVEWNRM
jgi:oxaloacetate decarboxylase alpha subunit